VGNDVKQSIAFSFSCFHPMAQYILLIHNNTKTDSTSADWDRFLTLAKQSGLFQGGSEIGERVLVGDVQSAKPTDHIVGFMRFDSDHKQKVLDLLGQHPVILHGGSAELCEMPRS
jgi:hypothetical protein